ncbi:MAG: hypothetical protein JST84_12185 [Acidobacteria bacterium]|nr:hypothetical protein [Acidobacteriota bacterium]
MERIIKVTLHKDSDGNYSLSPNPLTTLVSVIDEDGEPVNVRWVLAEDPGNPGFPNNARKLTASFDAIPTPFTVTSGNEPLPNQENYITASLGVGADVSTANVQDSSVGGDLNDSQLYKYTIVVETNDNQQVVLDPNIRVRRRRVTKDTILGY